MKSYKQWLTESKESANWSIYPEKIKGEYTEPLGFVPMQSQSEVEYRGLVGTITPTMFKMLTTKRGYGSNDSNIDHLKSAMERGDKIAPPFLSIDITDDKVVVTGHEGRTRLEASYQLYGNKAVPIILFVYANGGKLRTSNKELGKYIKMISRGVLSEKLEVYIENPIKNIETGENVSKYFPKVMKEDFATGFKQSGDYHEVYINPSKSEIKDFNGNMRLILDSKEKSLYVSSGDVLHDDSIKALRVDGFLQDFNYNSYWKEGKDIDRYLTFVIEHGDYYTDSITDLFFNDRGNKEQNIININKLLDKDFSWLNKFMWLDINKFNGMLDDIADAAKVKA